MATQQTAAHTRKETQSVSYFKCALNVRAKTLVAERICLSVWQTILAATLQTEITAIFVRQYFESICISGFKSADQEILYNINNTDDNHSIRPDLIS